MTTLRMAAGRAGVAPAVATCALLVLGWPGAAHGRVQRADIPNRTIIGAQLETDTITAAEAARIFSVDVAATGAAATCAAGEVLAVAGGVWACTALTGLSGTVTQTSNLTVEPATFTVDWQVVDGSATAYQLRGNEAGNPVFLLIDTSAALEAITLGSAGVGAITLTTDATGDAELVLPGLSVNPITEVGLATCVGNDYLRVNGGGTAWSCSAGVAPGPDSVTTAEILDATIACADTNDGTGADGVVCEGTAATFTAAIVFNGQADIGDNGDTVAINSSDWDISATGAMTGIGAFTSDGTLTTTGSVDFNDGAADTIELSDGNDTTTLRGATLTIGDAADDVSVTDANWSINGAGLITASEGQGFICQTGGTCTYDAGGAQAIVIGSADVTNITVNSDAGLTFANNSDSINDAADATFDFTRNDAGIVTLTASDNDATAALTILPGGAAALALGGASTTTATLDADSGLTFAGGSDSIHNNTDDVFTFDRDDAGSITLTCTDDNAACDLVVDSGTTGTVTVGSADTAGVQLLSTTGAGGLLEVSIVNGATGVVDLGFHDYADTTSDDMAHGRIQVDCTDTGAASEDCDMIFYAVEAGAAGERFRIDGDGGSFEVTAGVTTGDGAVVLPAGVISGTEMVNDTVGGDQLGDSITLDAAFTLTGTGANTIALDGLTSVQTVDNATSLTFDMPVTAGAATHTMSFRIDGNDGIRILAVGDGVGGIVGSVPIVEIATSIWTMSDTGDDGDYDNVSIVLDDAGGNFTVTDGADTVFGYAAGTSTITIGNATDAVPTVVNFNGTGQKTMSGNLDVTGGVDVSGANLTVASGQNLVLDSGGVSITVNPDGAGEILWTRSTTGSVTFNVADDDANADATYKGGGTGSTTLGGTSTTNVTMVSGTTATVGGAGQDAIALTTDGTGDAELTVPGESIAAGEITNLTRAPIHLPLRSFIECQTDAGADIGFGEGADALPDFINSATDGVGFTLRFDDSLAQEDQNVEICNQFVVPSDYVSTLTVRVRADKDAHAGATEVLNCDASINGAALTGTPGTVEITSASSTSYACTLPSSYAANDSVSLALWITSGGTMDDVVDLAAVEITYTATQ